MSNKNLNIMNDALQFDNSVTAQKVDKLSR